jgi:hypothetical protein
MHAVESVGIAAEGNRFPKDLRVVVLLFLLVYRWQKLDCFTPMLFMMGHFHWVKVLAF